MIGWLRGARPRARSMALAAAFCGGLAAGGCGTTNPHPAGSLERAQHYQQRGKGREAVAALDQFLRRDPPDSVAVAAQAMKARAYMGLEEYPLAAVEWQILRQEYPGTGEAAESLYEEGLCELRQVGRLQRDVTPAQRARNLLRRYLQQHPAGPRAADARARLQEISDLLVRKKLGEIQVYRRLGRPEAAGIVLDALIENESESSLLPQLLLLRGELALRARQPETAVRAFTRLVEDHPQSPQAARARRELSKLSGGGS